LYLSEIKELIWWRRRELVCFGLLKTKNLADFGFLTIRSIRRKARVKTRIEHAVLPRSALSRHSILGNEDGVLTVIASLNILGPALQIVNSCFQGRWLRKRGAVGQSFIVPSNPMRAFALQRWGWGSTVWCSGQFR
jgi:hypothetical protein